MSRWNRLRYSVWALVYDSVAVPAPGLQEARRTSIERLRLASGDRLLIVGAGTGLDLDFVPHDIHVTAIDVTPAMLHRLKQRAKAAGRPVDVRVMDARTLSFDDASFDGRPHGARRGADAG